MPDRPTLAALPPPPPGKTGWPWTVASPPLPDGVDWPRITIVTPSYNQGAYLEETLRSVLLQGYPNLEYLVMDGGSGDDSAVILRRYSPWLAGWVSERDRGQVDAIMKGFARATGTLLNWLNSDDYYLPGALGAVGAACAAHPGSLVAGSVEMFTEGTAQTRMVRQFGITLEHMVQFWEGKHYWHQPGLFFPRATYDAAGGLDPSVPYAMDHDLLCRMLLTGAGVEYLDTPVARFRMHPASITTTQNDRQVLEWSAVSRRYWDRVPGVRPADHDAYLYGELLRVACAAPDRVRARELFRRAGAFLPPGQPWKAPLYLCRYAWLQWRKIRRRRSSGA